MWRNDQVAESLDRLEAINRRIGAPEKKCGFYGLDVYSLSASIEAVLTYLDAVDPEAGRVARERYGCLTPWRAEPVRYGRMSLSRGYAVCERPVTDALIDLLRKRLDYFCSATARPSSTPSRMLASSPPLRNTTASCITATPCRGICATSICSTRWSACLPIAGLTQRPWSLPLPL
jgi:erythromycin esterase-like protein